MRFHQILTDGGAGDLIAEMVAVDYNIRKHPDITFYVWVPDYLLSLAKHLLPKGSIVRPFSKAKEKFDHEVLGTTTEWCGNHTPMRTHPVDYGFHMLSDRHIYDLNEKNYLQIRPEELDWTILPAKYVCVLGTAAEPVKAFPKETLEQISEWLMRNGYTPVFLGKEENDCGFNNMKTNAFKILSHEYYSYHGINLINKTSLLEAAAIIARSECIIGMDSGLIHLAGCTDTQIIAGYTLVDPIHVAPIRKGSQTYKYTAIEPDVLVKNRYYQTYYSGFQKGDFRKFPNWENVVASMTSEKFIKAMEEVL